MSAKFKKGDKVWAHSQFTDTSIFLVGKIAGVIPMRTEQERFMRVPLVTESTCYLVEYDNNPTQRYLMPESDLLKRTKTFNGF